MKRLQYYQNKAQIDLFEKTGSFYTSNESQFNSHKKENIVYVSLNNNLFCPKENIKELISGLNDIYGELFEK